MSHIVEVKGLTKRYKDTTAVNDVTFALEENKIYGLLGRNGAGKTTIMHMLTAQAFPTGGELAVFGEPPFENNRVLSRMCFIKESQKYPDMYRVVDVFSAAADFFPEWDREYALALAQDFQLPAKRRMKKLSRGMQSAVGIIVGLASRAPLTIFDEPYLGLDAVARSLFYDRLLEDYAENPRTIVLSTHLIDEVSKMLEHVLVIDRGRLILNEDAESLRGQASTVVGAASKAEAFCIGRQVIHRESIGSLASMTFIGRLDAEDRKQAEQLGLELAPVSLQQLIVHLTKNNEPSREGGSR